MVLRSFVDGARMRGLVRDNGIGKTYGYRYLHEGIDVLPTAAPDLAAVPDEAKGRG